MNILDEIRFVILDAHRDNLVPDRIAVPSGRRTELDAVLSELDPRAAEWGGEAWVFGIPVVYYGGDRVTLVDDDGRELWVRSVH